MKIAILGAGFAGFGTAYYLYYHSKGTVTIDLFDPMPIGTGVSGHSSGLFHAYTGRKAEQFPKANKYLECTHHLITEASKGVNRSVVLSKGIFRPASHEQQVEDFKKSAEKHSDTLFWDQESAEAQVSGMSAPWGGLFISSGLTLDVAAYLEGLWQICLRFGLKHHPHLVTKQSELASYDRVVFAIGANIQRFPFFSDLPIHRMKGQLLKLQWPRGLPPLPFSLLASDAHLVMGKDNSTCLAGSTFEREFSDEKPQPEKAIPEIMQKITTFFPPLAGAQVLDCMAGIRAMPERGKGPLLGQATKEYWFITGLGSKGLLQHGYLTSLLAQALLQDDFHLLEELQT